MTESSYADVTIGVCTTSAARIGTTEIHASSIGIALKVWFALTATSLSIYIKN